MDRRLPAATLDKKTCCQLQRESDRTWPELFVQQLRHHGANLRANPAPAIFDPFDRPGAWASHIEAEFDLISNGNTGISIKANPGLRDVSERYKMKARLALDISTFERGDDPDVVTSIQHLFRSFLRKPHQGFYGHKRNAAFIKPIP